MTDEFDFDAEVPEEFMEAEIIESFPALTTDTDLQPIALNLVPYQVLVAEITKQSKEIVVSDKDSKKTAVELRLLAHKKWKELEDLRTQIRKPLNDRLTEIQNIFKIIQDPLLEAIGVVKGQEGQYETKLELERRRIEAEKREAQRKLQEGIDAEAKRQRDDAAMIAQAAKDALAVEEDPDTRTRLEETIKVEEVAAVAPTPVAPEVAAAKREIIRTTAGSSYTRFKWVGVIIDPEKVSREYCEPSQKKINEAVKAGERKIDGVLIKEVPDMVSRV